VQASAKASGPRAAAALIAGNLVAGLVASLAYFLVTAVPSFWLLAGVVCLIALVFGERIAAANEASPLFVMIASATLILLGTGLTPFMDTSTAFASRVTGVVLGSAYCVTMLAALQAWLGRPSQQ